MAHKRQRAQTDVIHPDAMEELARTLDAVLPELTSSGKRLGFAVLVFDFGDGGNMQWCSNAKREDMIAALRELLGKWAADGSVPN